MFGIPSYWRVNQRSQPLDSVQSEADPELRTVLLKAELRKLREASQYDSTTLDRAKQHAEILPDVEDQVDVDLMVIDFYLDFGQKKPALALIKRLVHKMEMVPRNRQYRSWLSLGHAAINLSDTTSALMYFDHALDSLNDSEIPDILLAKFMPSFPVEVFKARAVPILRQIEKRAETVGNLGMKVNILQDVASGYAVSGAIIDSILAYDHAVLALRAAVSDDRAEALYKIANGMHYNGIAVMHYYRYLLEAADDANYVGTMASPSDRAFLLGQISALFLRDHLLSEAVSTLFQGLAVAQGVVDVEQRQHIIDKFKDGLNKLGFKD